MAASASPMLYGFWAPPDSPWEADLGDLVTVCICSSVHVIVSGGVLLRGPRDSEKGAVDPWQDLFHCITLPTRTSALQGPFLTGARGGHC